MRIGHVTTHYLPIAGGQESYTHELVSLLEACGHQNVVYQWQTDVHDPRLRPVPRPPRALLALREGMQYWLYDALLPLRLPSLVRDDLLIVHFPFHFPAVAWHRRTLVLSHGVEWDQPARRVPHRLRRAIARFAFDHAGAIVANDTNYLREMGVAIGPGERPYEEIRPGRFYIPNAVDPDRFAPAEPLPGLSDLEVVLVPRNVWPARGIHLAIDAFAEVARKHSRAHLVIAGDLWDMRYVASLHAQIRSHGLDGRVLFTGPYPSQEMPRLYASALVTLVPSIRSEGTSLAALESMACGTPCVTTDIGGLADLPSAQAAPVADDLAATILAVLADRDRTADRQRAAVLADFHIDRWASAWRRAVEHALS